MCPGVEKGESKGERAIKPVIPPLTEIGYGQKCEISITVKINVSRGYPQEDLRGDLVSCLFSF